LDLGEDLKMKDIEEEDSKESGTRKEIGITTVI
jgi:hypothetical protein